MPPVAKVSVAAAERFAEPVNVSAPEPRARFAVPVAVTSPTTVTVPPVTRSPSRSPSSVRLPFTENVPPFPTVRAASSTRLNPVLSLTVTASTMIVLPVTIVRSTVASEVSKVTDTGVAWSTTTTPRSLAPPWTF